MDRLAASGDDRNREDSRAGPDCGRRPDAAETDNGGAGAEPADLRTFAGDQGTWSVVDVIPQGEMCVVALIEHRWAIPLRDAIYKTGGRTLADAWIHPDDPVLGRLG